MLRLNSFGSTLVSALAGSLLAIGVAVPAHATCQLNSPSGKIQHVVYIEFDNVHYTRDNPNVPSDLEQMPNLLNFLEDEGTLFTNHHTPLISHTAVDILTSLTGVCGDKFGVPIGNNIGCSARMASPASRALSPIGPI
jgi:hypothetical protein